MVQAIFVCLTGKPNYWTNCFKILFDIKFLHELYMPEIITTLNEDVNGQNGYYLNLINVKLSTYYDEEHHTSSPNKVRKEERDELHAIIDDQQNRQH